MAIFMLPLKIQESFYYNMFTWKIHRLPDSCRLVNWDQLFFLLPAESDLFPLLLPRLLLPPLLTWQGKDTGSRILSDEDESSPERSGIFEAGLEVESSKIESSMSNLRCCAPVNSDALAFQGIVSLLPPCDVRPQAKNILAPSLLHFRCPGTNFFGFWLSLPPPIVIRQYATYKRVFWPSSYLKLCRIGDTNLETVYTFSRR